MRAEIKKLIKSELYAYKINKSLIDNLGITDPVNPNHLLWKVLIVQGIELTLSTLPTPIKNYVMLRYFAPNQLGIYSIVRTLSVSERTLRSWDQKVFTQIAKSIGLIHCINKKQGG
mgnify:CR=1 FL=1